MQVWREPRGRGGLRHRTNQHDRADRRLRSTCAGEGASPEGRSPVPRSAEPEDARNRAPVPQRREQLRDGRHAAARSGGKKLLTRHETRTDPPNYFVRDLGAASKQAVTTFKDPHPQITAAERMLVTYKRKDGVQLSRHDLPAAGLQAGRARADVRVGVSRASSWTPTPRARSSGRPTGSRPVDRRVAPAAADAGLRDLRRTDHADCRAGRDGERHLRRAARGQRAGRRRQGRRAGNRRSRIGSASAATATARS